MSEYTQKNLDSMRLLELRRICTKLGIKEVSGKREAELKRMILTAQKPGGDARINPKKAAEAKAAKVTKEKPAAPAAPTPPKATRKKKLEVVPPPEPEPAAEEAQAPANWSAVAAEWERRLARIEAALAKEGMLDLEAVTPALAGKVSSADPILLENYIDEDGNIILSAEDIEQMNFDTMKYLADEIGKKNGTPSAVTEDMRKKPRVARGEILKLCREFGILDHDEDAAEAELDATAAEDEAEEASDDPYDNSPYEAPEDTPPFPPEEEGDLCVVEYEGGRYIGRFTGTNTEEDGEQFWAITFFDENEDEVEVEFDESEIYPYGTPLEGELAEAEG